MEIYVMRHGQAKMVAKNDSQRELTAQGRTQIQSMALQLSREVNHFEYVFVSPYIRAQQTWQEVSSYFPKPQQVQDLDDLTPNGDALNICALVQELASDSRVLLISHLPLVGYIVEGLVPQAGAPLFTTAAVAHISITDQSELISLDYPN